MYLFELMILFFNLLLIKNPIIFMQLLDEFKSRDMKVVTKYCGHKTSLVRRKVLDYLRFDTNNVFRINNQTYDIQHFFVLLIVIVLEIEDAVVGFNEGTPQYTLEYFFKLPIIRINIVNPFRI